jgi:hypothetical protein
MPQLDVETVELLPLGPQPSDTNYINPILVMPGDDQLAMILSSESKSNWNELDSISFRYM